MSGVARMASGIDVNPNGRHWSLLSVRRPQCVSLRDELNVRSTFRFNALMMPMRAIHGRPVELDDEEHGFDRGLPLLEQLLGFGKLLDIFGGILEGDELATAHQPRSAPAPVCPWCAWVILFF